ncbi:MAG: T9SS type A sorting domain-containing protein [Bacteroidota bacterium]
MGNGGKLAFNTEQTIVILRSCISLITEPLVLSPEQNGGCFGESVLLIAPDNLPNYFWSTGANTQTISVDQEGDYFFAVADSLGCLSPPSNTVSVKFDFQPSSPFITGSTVIELCQGQSTTLTASNASNIASYLWSTGETTRSIEVDSGGIYSVAGVSSNGCIGNLSNSIDVRVSNDTIPDQPIIAVDSLVEFCQGESTMLSAPDGFDFYRWSTGSNAQMIEVTTTGIYSVEVAEDIDCFSPRSQSVMIEVNPTPNTPFVQANGNLLASSAVDGNQWFLNGVPIAGATGQFHTAIKDGFYTVQVNLNGCSSAVSDLYNHTLVNVNEVLPENKMLIFPNPTNDVLYIQYKENPQKNIYRIEVYNQLGQSVLQTFQTNQLSVHNYAPGLFLIKLYDETNTIIKVGSFLKT